MLACLACASFAIADERVTRMTQRVSQEAAAFSKSAPHFLTQETLRQRALSPKGWQQREVVSEYGYSALNAQPQAIHEFRRVISVDGKNIEKPEKALDALARNITATDDHGRRALLKQFEKYGLVGAAADFGQLILLFGPGRIDRYEFRFSGQKDGVAAFAYKQLDGTDTVTIYEGGKRIRQSLSGEIWVRAADYLPLRITLRTDRGDGLSAVRDEASVVYSLNPANVLLPAGIEHRELRGGSVVVENHFTYLPFHAFGVASE